MIDPTTLIATRDTGIERSTDLGASWTRVSEVTPLSHVAVRFRDRFYLTGEHGLLVSDDGGESWQIQGAAIEGQRMLLGPHFGADELTMVVGVHRDQDAFGGVSAIHKTVDGGQSWTKIVDVPPRIGEFPGTFAWFGSFAWDPVDDVYYVSSMSNPARRLDCAP